MPSTHDPKANDRLYRDSFAGQDIPELPTPKGLTYGARTIFRTMQASRRDLRHPSRGDMLREFCVSLAAERELEPELVRLQKIITEQGGDPDTRADLKLLNEVAKRHATRWKGLLAPLNLSMSSSGTKVVQSDIVDVGTVPTSATTAKKTPARPGSTTSPDVLRLLRLAREAKGE